MDHPWLAVYRDIDDDALAALASVGLLRRAQKDVEAGKVGWEAPPEAGHALLRADGQLVRVNPDGPARASCDCPAPGICKHILSAALWLRTVPDSTAAAAAGTPEPDVLAEVMALDPAAIFKAAGTAAVRKAYAQFAGASQPGLSVNGAVLVIELPAQGVEGEPGMVCRYLSGAGLAGMVSDAPPSTRAAVHVLALASVWRAHGRGFAWPAHIPDPAAGASAPLGETEQAFLRHVRELVLEACRSGWSHVSEVMPVQLNALAMSARIEAFPRLSGLLRALAGSATELARRELWSDERRALALAARIHALCHALALASGDALALLRGRAQRSFGQHTALALLPLGAHWWVQRSGARGLTMAFWDPASASILQAVLARRDGSDRSFNRADAWALQPLWHGAGPAQQLDCTTLLLDQARLSSDNRLSLSSETRASKLPPWDADDTRLAQAGFDDWRALARAVQDGAGLGADALEYLLLRPAVLAAPQLDELHQLQCWTMLDRQGLPLVLRLSCVPAHHRRAANLEAWAACGAQIKAVLVRLDRESHGGILEPVSLLVNSGGQLRSVSLDYEAPASGKALDTEGSIARLRKWKQRAGSWTAPAGHLAGIAALLGILEHKGMTGRLHQPGEDRAQLQALRQMLRASGIDTVADALGRYLASPDTATALVLLHLCHSCTQLDTGFLRRQTD